jgi:hypothetical protein
MGYFKSGVYPFICFCLALAMGCTAVTVVPIGAEHKIQKIYIQDNPKVIVQDFVPVVRDGLSRHGIQSEVFCGPCPKDAEYVLTYTALRSWDMAPYLSHAEIRIEKGGIVIASAEYHLRGKGGFSLAKWAGTKSKIDPVIDELLSKFSRSEH